MVDVANTTARTKFLAPKGWPECFGSGMKFSSSNDVRGKVDLDFRIAAIPRKRDESRQTIPTAFIEASPTINVAFQDGSVLPRREWPLLVATLAFVIRQL